MRSLLVTVVMSLLALSLGGGCAYSPPLDTDPHAVLRLLLTSASGNYLEAELAIDSRDVDQEILAKGRFNVSPGAHTMRVKLLSAERTVGKVRKVFGLGKTKARSVKMRNVNRCSGGIKFRVAADVEYEIHVANTADSSTCMVECARMVKDADGALRRQKCAMTRRY